MIPLRDIIAWQAQAPWPRQEQVEQDYLLTQAMGLIFSDRFLSAQVAMRGGTVLHKVHLAPAARYSEDIDLVQIGDRPPAHIARALIRVLSPLLGPPRQNAVEFVTLTIRNMVQKSKIIRQEYEFQPTSAPGQVARIKIEVNTNERKPVYNVVELPYSPAGSGLPANLILKSYDINEMLGTKMRALLQRRSGRDLFDLWWSWDLSQKGLARQAVDPEKAVAAFMTYMANEGTVVTRRDYESELDRKMAVEAFRRDMDAMLRPGIPEYDINVANKVVRAEFLSRLP